MVPTVSSIDTNQSGPQYNFLYRGKGGYKLNLIEKAGGDGLRSSISAQMLDEIFNKVLGGLAGRRPPHFHRLLHKAPSSLY